MYKICFQYDTANEDVKDSPRRTAADKVLRDKAFNIAKNLKYDANQRKLASMVYNFFKKNLLVVVLKARLYQTKN